MTPQAVAEDTKMNEQNSLADALPREIARVQAKRERWLEYQREAGPRVMFGPALLMMKAHIEEGVAALASGDVVRMLAAHQDLKDYNDDD